MRFCGDWVCTSILWGTWCTEVDCTDSLPEVAEQLKEPFAVRELLVVGLQASTEASYHEFRKEQLSLRTDTKISQPKSASTHIQTSTQEADWTAPLQSSAPANGPNQKEARTADETVSSLRTSNIFNTDGGLQGAVRHPSQTLGTPHM